MRSLTKIAEPQVLADNATDWLAAFKEQPDNSYRRFRYRHDGIKGALKVETGNKCVYCESKIGHNTPGDVEHKIPTSKNIDKHFEWENLTIACTECNRRKDDFYKQFDGFVDPYVDDIAAMLQHLGPLVHWAPGDARAETAVKILELHNAARIELLSRKADKLEETAGLVERYRNAKEPALKAVLFQQLLSMADALAEYSAMVVAALRRKGVLPLLPSSGAPPAGDK